MSHHMQNPRKVRKQHLLFRLNIIADDDMVIFSRSNNLQCSFFFSTIYHLNFWI